MPNETRPPLRLAAASPDGNQGGGPQDGPARRRRTRRGGGRSGPGPDLPDNRPAARDADPVAAAPAGSDEDLVVVRFKGHRKAYYHNRAGVDLRVGQYCMVEADRGCDLGRVAYLGRGPAAWWVQARRQGVIGPAGAGDLGRLHDNRRDEWGFWDLARQKIAERGLAMDLVGGRAPVRPQEDHVLLHSRTARRLPPAGARPGRGVPHPHRAAPDRRARRGPPQGWPGPVRPRVLLRLASCTSSCR